MQCHLYNVYMWSLTVLGLLAAATIFNVLGMVGLSLIVIYSGAYNKCKTVRNHIITEIATKCKTVQTLVGRGGNEGKGKKNKCFKHIEPRRTFSNHIITEIARCVEFCHMSLGGFDCTEPVRTFSIYIVTGETRCTSSGWFKHIEPYRTFSNHIITKIARCVEFCHMSSGWFDCTEPSLSTSLQGKQDALVRGGSSTSNLIEPSRTTSLQR